MQKHHIMIIIIIFTFFIVSCAMDSMAEFDSSKDVRYEGTFINKSSITLTISPDEQDWYEFILEPEESHTIDTYYNEIKFTVNSEKVTWEYNELSGSIIFYDKASQAECIDGDIKCADNYTIANCKDGRWQEHDCDEVCVSDKENNYSYSTGCAFDSEENRAYCYCE